MVKAGYSGSGINDVIWMGDVVNTACHLANKAGRGIRNKIVVTEQIYNNLNDSHKKLLSEIVRRLPFTIVIHGIVYIPPNAITLCIIWLQGISSFTIRITDTFNQLVVVNLIT